MRVIQTYVLKLLSDTDEPQAIRGAVRSVAGGQEQAFSDGASLLGLLRHMSLGLEPASEQEMGETVSVAGNGPANSNQAKSSTPLEPAGGGA